jgi:hypothetical protein
MKVIKTAVYRITTSMGCGCAAQQEFEDADYKKPIGKTPAFAACKKHKEQPGVDLVEMVLTERVTEEAENHVPVPVAPVTPVRENASAVVDHDGNLVMRVPVQVRPGGAIVRPSGATATTGAPNAPIQSAVGGRPVAPLPPPGGQRTASNPPAPRPAVPVNRAQAARTGPVRTYQRPTSSAETAPRPAAVNAAGAEEEPDLFDQNDPDFQNAR